MFHKLLIANRGEIAVRILRACREMGIPTVAVYSEADTNALHTKLADQAFLIGGSAPTDSYLRGERILQVAQAHSCEAIHPGYGFLSENADFAEAVLAAGLIFVGPSPAAMRAMGSKTAARANMMRAGVPVVPGFQASDDDSALLTAAADVGFPLLVKAAAGGGGKGMRVVRSLTELPDALQSARREAQNAFGDGRVYLEKLIESPRHIEFQILGDSHGHIVHLFERECSIQRRHQKIIEETPSPFLDAALRQRMGEAAIQAARTVGYTNAGTIEFLVDHQHNFYFLEMNTRLQVEHPITELVTGLDLVKWQLRIAAGEPFPFQQAALSQRGHAIECRLYAEDPSQGFFPSIGKVTNFHIPLMPGVRIDSGLRSGDEITLHYDPMIAKLSVLGETRADAIARVQQALQQSVIEGEVITNLPFLRDILAHPSFQNGETDTGFIARHFANWQPTEQATKEPEAKAESAPTQPIQPMQILYTADASDLFSPWRSQLGFRIGQMEAKSGQAGGVSRQSASRTQQTRRASNPIGSSGVVTAPMPGLVTNVLVKVGDPVAKGDTLVLLEAMKMELRISAPMNGHVQTLHCANGEVVKRGEIIVEIGE